MNSKSEKIKGITLIVLVITILVLIILVAIILNSNNKLIDMAGNASKKYVNDQGFEHTEMQSASKDIELITSGRSVDENNVKNIILDVAFPIGSIYTSVSEENPASFLGGEWQQISEGRVLMGAGTNGSLSYTAGTTVEAGLPNITGRSNLCIWAHGPSGAFYMTRNGSYNNAGANGGTAEYFADFNASRCSAVYGRSSTVQPPAYIVYMWQRTA